jgi:hypothetical protein
LDVRNIFPGSHTEHQWQCSYIDYYETSHDLQI